jgi:hypothetical protein
VPLLTKLTEGRVAARGLKAILINTSAVDHCIYLGRIAGLQGHGRFPLAVNLLVRRITITILAGGIREVALADNRYIVYKPSADSNCNIAPGANTERVNTYRIAKPANNLGYSY